MSPIRIVCLGLLLLGACAERSGPTPFVPGPIGARQSGGIADAAPPPGTDLRDRARVTVACREAADRVITIRDRGQLLREDERDARVGSQASIYAQRAETDRLGRIFERDQLAAECVGQNARGDTGQNARGDTGQNARGETGQNARGETGQNARGGTLPR